MHELADVLAKATAQIKKGLASTDTVKYFGIHRGEVGWEVEKSENPDTRIW